MSTPVESRPVTAVRTVRYFAGAKAAAGVGVEDVTAEAVGREPTVAAVLAAATARHGGDDGPLARVLAASSLLLDGLAVHDRDQPVAPDAVLDVLPPFAGG